MATQKRLTFRLVVGYNHFKNEPLYQINGVNNEYDGDWFVSKLICVQELVKLEQNQDADSLAQNADIAIDAFCGLEKFKRHNAGFGWCLWEDKQGRLHSPHQYTP